jgi:hypothetical protein
VRHDQLFRVILERLFEEFLELFFPDIAGKLDFQTLRFLDKEIFANVPEGEVREADIVARLQTREGREQLVLVHVEIQLESKADFARRMFHYYSILRLHYGLPVVPIALYLRGGPRTRRAEYREALFDEEYLVFRYQVVALARFRAEAYVGAGALGAALSALMGRGSRHPAELRLSMLERIAESPVVEVVKFLLVNVIETYFVLSKDDTEKYLRLLARKENRAVQDLELTWADKLMEKGRQAGVIEGKRETLSRQLRVKFGPLPEDVMNRIAAIGTLAELDTYLDRIPTAKSLVEIGLVE